MRENRTFAVVTYAAAGLFVGHFLVGADWLFAICLAVSFAGLVKGVLDNRVEDAVVNGCMIILFPLIAALFPSLWAACAKTLAGNGRMLDATDGRLLSRNSRELVFFSRTAGTVAGLIARGFTGNPICRQSIATCALGQGNMIYFHAQVGP